MTTVVSCTGCERFVRASDSECPFCGAARTARVTTLRRPHIARAAMVAMALAGGCGTAAPVYGGPPPESAPPPSDDGSDSTSEDTQAEDTQDVEAEDEIEYGTPAPLYGAAPPQE